MAVFTVVGIVLAVLFVLGLIGAGAFALMVLFAEGFHH